MIDSRRKLAVVLLGLAVFAPVLAGIVRGAYSVGVGVRAGRLAVLLDLLMWYLPIVVTMNVLVGALQSSGSVLNFGAKKLHLTTVQSRSLAFGLLAVDVQSWLVVMVGPMALVVASYAVGTGSLTTVVVATTAVILLLLTAILWGYVLGLVGRLLWRRFSHIDVPDTLLRVVGILGLGLTFGVGGIFVGSFAAKFEDGLSMAAVVPDGQPPVLIGPCTEYLVYGTPIADGLSTAAVLNGLAVVAMIPLGVACVAWTAPRLWYGTSTPKDTDDATTGTADDQSGSTVQSPSRDWPWLRSPIGLVVDGIVRRTFRTPGRLLHLSYYVLVLGVLVAASLTAPSLLFPLLGVACALFGVWIAGGAVGLNPIGEEGPMLGQLVLSECHPRVFVRARIVAGVVLGLPFVILGIVLFVLDGYPLMDIVTGGTFLIILLPVSATIAVGVGTLIPKSTSGTALETDLSAPELLAIMLHSSASGVLAVVGVGFATGVWVLPRSMVGVAVVSVTTLLFTDLCYRFAVNRMANHGRRDWPSTGYVIEQAIAVTALGSILSITFPAGVGHFIWVLPPSISAVMSIAAGAISWTLTGSVVLLAGGRSLSSFDLAIPGWSDLPFQSAVLLASITIGATLSRAGVPADVVGAQRIWLQLPLTGGVATVGIGVTLLIAHAASTEFLFRTVLQQRLRRVLSGPRTILAIAVLCTAVNLPFAVLGDVGDSLLTLAAFFVLAVVWGYNYDRSNSLMAIVFAHVCFALSLVAI